jgi:hypothetical protein
MENKRRPSTSQPAGTRPGRLGLFGRPNRIRDASVRLNRLAPPRFGRRGRDLLPPAIRQPADTRAEGGSGPRPCWLPAPAHACRNAPGPASPIWGYQGVSPGPLLRVKRGQELCVRLINELPEPTAIHRQPGLIQTAVAAGARFAYRFRPPDAGTFWYHAPWFAAELSGRQRPAAPSSSMRRSRRASIASMCWSSTTGRVRLRTHCSRLR